MSRLTLLAVLLLPILLTACASDPASNESVRPAAAGASSRSYLARGDYGRALDATTWEIEDARRYGDRSELLDVYLKRGEALIGLQRHSEARGYLAMVNQEGSEQQRRDAVALQALSHDRQGNLDLARVYYREIQPTKVSQELWYRVKSKYSWGMRQKPDRVVESDVPPGPPVVTIIPRSRWTHEAIRRSNASRMEPPRRITVHHTAMTASPMSEGAAAERLRKIQRAHFARGWADIGYHYVIDPNGRIWEARSLRYQGAHAGNHQLNRANIGVSLMGNFSRQQVWPEQRGSLGDLLGMLSRRYGIQDHAICGHCKLKNTECPGHHLRHELPEIVQNMNRAQAPVGRTHVVARGETLSQIARRYGVSLGSLRRVNPGRGDHLRPGDQIAVP